MSNAGIYREDYSNREALHKQLGEYLINITNNTFVDKNIFLDGYRFINCYFKDCTLITLRGTFEFHNCLMEGGFRRFDEDALKAIQFFNIDSKEIDIDGFKPVVHQNGTVSIAKQVSI